MRRIRISDHIREAISSGRPIVGIESAIVDAAKGYPGGLATYQLLADHLKAQGVMPALFYVHDGFIVIENEPQKLEDLFKGAKPKKLGIRDLGVALALKETGLTTVSSASYCAHRAGIRLLITGAIGGVHRGYESSLDLSSDITTLGKTPVAVVCSGAKAILDLPKTLECLETHSIPVLGHQTDRFPSYYGITELAIESFNTGEHIARALHEHWSLGLTEGAIIAVKPPTPVPTQDLNTLVEKSIAKAEQANITGKDITPFLLKEIEHNFPADFKALKDSIFTRLAQVAAEIAIHHADLMRKARAT